MKSAFTTHLNQIEEKQYKNELLSDGKWLTTKDIM